MEPAQLIAKVPDKLATVVGHFSDELKKIRTGRAHPSILDGVMVSAYGVQMPLNQVASIIAPEAQMLQVTPFDPSNLQAIVSSIRDNQSLGLNPSDDGHVIRLVLPALTEERRRELTKSVSHKQEEAMVALRNIRHEAINILDKAQKDKQLSEDESKRLERQVDEAMNKSRNDIEIATKLKNQEIMTV